MNFNDETVFLMKNKLQNYSWGSIDFIADFTGNQNEDAKPQAELWLGSHPRASSIIISSSGEHELSELILSEPVKFLGKEAGSRYSSLPFLFKILSAAKPLSIQVHPSKEQAEKGFMLEEERLLPLDAKIRNYKDKNHKPEMMLALTQFYALSGIRPFADIIELIGFLRLDQKIEEFHDLTIDISEKKIRYFFNWLLHLKGRQKSKVRNNILRAASLRRGCDHSLSLAIEWICRLDHHYPDDIGIAAPLLLNTIEMHPGEALYMDAGIMHAYLLGSGLEIMANSDNVLRCALTPKHVDIQELLSIAKLKPEPPQIIKPFTKGLEEVYSTPAKEFQLSRIKLHSSIYINSMKSAEILLVESGEVSVIPQNGKELDLKKGESAFITHKAEGYHIKGNAVVYRAQINPEI